MAYIALKHEKAHTQLYIIIASIGILSQHRFALFSTHAAAADLYGQKYGINITLFRLGKTAPQD